MGIVNCIIEEGVIIHHPELVNLYGCTIKRGSKIGSFVEIQKDAVIKDRTVISSHSFVCSYTTIENDVFIGHGCVFSNDKNPIPNNPDYKALPTLVEHHASIGSRTTLLPVKVGHHAIIGAASLVTKDIPPYAIAYGHPARIIQILTEQEWKERMGIK